MVVAKALIPWMVFLLCCQHTFGVYSKQAVLVGSGTYAEKDHKSAAHAPRRCCTSRCVGSPLCGILGPLCAGQSNPPSNLGRSNTLFRARHASNCPDQIIPAVLLRWHLQGPANVVLQEFKLAYAYGPECIQIRNINQKQARRNRVAKSSIATGSGYIVTWGNQGNPGDVVLLWRKLNLKGIQIEYTRFPMYCVLAELFYNKQFLKQLQRTPGMTWKAGIPSKFASMTKDEVRARLTTISEHAANTATVRHVKDAPESWNWQTERPECSGRTTVRDQGQCGSCWAFSSANQLGDNRCINGLDAKRVQYSEQYVVSCDTVNSGCTGGWLSSVQKFLISTGTALDRCIPYTSGTSGRAGACPTTCQDGTPITLTHSTAYENVSYHEESIVAALTLGTVQVGFNVYSDFMYYTGGIYRHIKGSLEGGHAVMMVGYGVEDGVKFWNAKNSWGNDWGEDGYFRILRGVNECGIEEQCYFLTP